MVRILMNYPESLGEVFKSVCVYECEFFSTPKTVIKGSNYRWKKTTKLTKTKGVDLVEKNYHQ